MGIPFSQEMTEEVFLFRSEAKSHRHQLPVILKNDFFKLCFCCSFLFLLSFFAISPSIVNAANPFRDFIVYPYETPEQGEFSIGTWQTLLLPSKAAEPMFGKSQANADLLFSTYLLEFGVTDWLTFGTYEDFLAGAGQTYSYYQTRAITTRIRFPKIPDFIDPAVQIEYWLPAAGANEESLLDVILIGEKKIGNFILDINMSYLFETANPSGPTAALPPDFGYAAGLYYLLADWVNTGIEAFGDQGSINNMLPLGGNGQVTQQDYVFSSWNFAIGENIDWNIGIGAGLTANSAPFAIKTIFEYHFNPFKTEHESEKDTEERDIH